MGQKESPMNCVMSNFSEEILSGWGRGWGEGAIFHLRHWGYLFFCVLQVFHANVQHSVCGHLPCLSQGKRRERECKKKKKIIWMVNRRGTCAALASCHCLLCKRCQSHHIRLPPQGACKWESERGSAEQPPPAHFRLLAGTLQWTKTE